MDELKAENLQLAALVDELQQRLAVEKIKNDVLWSVAVELAKNSK